MEEGTQAAALPDDLVVEILARLPARSLCRFRCVSRSWRRLISDPAHRARFAQTLSGLFRVRHYRSLPGWSFAAGLSTPPPPPPPGVDTALSFLPAGCGETTLVHTCNGLLLLRRRSPPQPPFYVVCNPATGEWITLPQPSHAPGQYDCFNDELMGDISTCNAALGFDPAVSSHFHVFQLVQKVVCFDYDVVAVEIFSSETGSWVLKENGWDEHKFDRECTLTSLGPLTFFNGFLHFCIHGDAVASVDTKGQTWRLSIVQHREIYGYGFLGHSQGHLQYADLGNHLERDTVSIYVLEDDDSWEWTFKHNITMLDLFQPGMSDWFIAAFHPHGNLIFFYDSSQERLMSYDLNRRDVHVICTLEEEFNEYRSF
ncbi:hypothetical protein ACP4OV_003129 [Aristida adscensionis]